MSEVLTRAHILALREAMDKAPAPEVIYLQVDPGIKVLVAYRDGEKKELGHWMCYDSAFAALCKELVSSKPADAYVIERLCDRMAE